MRLNRCPLLNRDRIRRRDQITRGAITGIARLSRVWQTSSSKLGLAGRSGTCQPDLPSVVDGGGASGAKLLGSRAGSTTASKLYGRTGIGPSSDYGVRAPTGR